MNVSQLRMCRPLPPPPLRSGHIDIKDAQRAETKDGREISYRVCSKVTQCSGKIGIDLTLINCINGFSCAILSF